MGQLVEGKWTADGQVPRGKNGEFVRGDSGIRNWITADGSSSFPAVPGRYLLYVSYACPWAHRTLLVRAIKGLSHAIDVAVVDWHMTEDGWHFSDRDGATPDPVAARPFLRDVYTASNPTYSGRVTVPVLWDTQTAQIVSNESAEIIRMFNDAFIDQAENPIDIYPPTLRPDIDQINDRIYATVNNGVYKCGFAGTQAAYETAFEALFETLDLLEDRLGWHRYLIGNHLTEADIRLFPTLIRFDAVYVNHFKCNRQRIVDYPNLWNYLRDLYQHPGIAEAVDFHHIKQHYFRSHGSINPLGIVPKGPDLDFTAPHDRDRFTN
ncbi:MAG: glutathione S-transferase family protein [Alphaproteobacteria bacterium]|nr:glutathione S-transferase family protein [Alphaproteobacteria bacterium]